MKHPYNDIIQLPHHRSANHPHMTMHDRAAQFAPFSALTGYDSIVQETARQTHTRTLQDAAELEILNRKITYLHTHAEEKPVVRIISFVPDEKKSGGSYREETGIVEKIDLTGRWIAMASGNIYSADCICAIDGDCFADL
jgi:hypothetical protein